MKMRKEGFGKCFGKPRGAVTTKSFNPSVDLKYHGRLLPPLSEMKSYPFKMSQQTEIPPNYLARVFFFFFRGPPFCQNLSKGLSSWDQRVKTEVMDSFWGVGLQSRCVTTVFQLGFYLCVCSLAFSASSKGIWFSSACIYSTVWIKDFKQSRVGGGLSTDCSLSALPTGRTHPFKLSDDGPNPQLALLNHRISPQNFLSFPLWKRSLFWVLLHTLMWRVKRRLRVRPRGAAKSKNIQRREHLGECC